MVKIIYRVNIYDALNNLRLEDQRINANDQINGTSNKFVHPLNGGSFCYEIPDAVGDSTCSYYGK